jgi:hypothetical protein
MFCRIHDLENFPKLLRGLASDLAKQVGSGILESGGSIG